MSRFTANADGGQVSVFNPRQADTEKKSHKSSFRQQKLPAWKPVLTTGAVCLALFIIGLLFIPIGIALSATSANIKEVKIDYTGMDKSSSCFSCWKSSSWNNTCKCTVPFFLDRSFDSTVFMYYGLSNFYQNHRRFVSSRHDSQLNGNMESLMEPSKDCEPYAFRDNKPIAPCGAIANSMFNDTLDLFRNVPTVGDVRIPLTGKGIAWWTDKHLKFKNPGGQDQNLTTVFQGILSIWSNMSSAKLLTFDHTRDQPPAQLAPARQRARPGPRKQRIHQRGLHRLDAQRRPADLPQALPHHPQNQEDADSCTRKLHAARGLQLSSSELPGQEMGDLEHLLLDGRQEPISGRRLPGGGLC
uniref:cell cycle control protein 50A-like isoform X2 n=1 Tax=Doryrhamphus excisus TaxID=161450 RepID=UPI0025ADBDA1|nr:cell cycle control protein 50A-like isoform X2 [Doryrhamphus excisus]